MKTYEFNFVDPNVPADYAELLMGPYEEDDGITIHLTSEYRSMAHIMAKVGFLSLLVMLEETDGINQYQEDIQNMLLEKVIKRKLYSF